jgi:soluble lytic murein transglycosylase-like protein
MRAIFAAAAACLLLGACSTVGMTPALIAHHHHYRAREHDDRALVIIGAPAPAQAQHDVGTAAAAAGVPPAIAHAVARQESDENPRAPGGIMQVLPRTAREVGENARSYWGQLRAGMKYLRQALEIRGATLCEKISAYNRGLHAPLKCTAYGRKVLQRARRRRPVNAPL